MKAPRILIPFVLSMASLPLAQDVSGDWHGTLSLNGAELRLVLHISNTDQGLAVAVDVPDQNAKGLPVTSITRSGTSLKFEMKEIGGAYEGNINSNLDTFHWCLDAARQKPAAGL